jgi:hypothetical protein
MVCRHVTVILDKNKINTTSSKIVFFGHNPTYLKKSLKIPKGQSESVYRRRTDNTMAKRKKYKRTNNDLQNIHIKLKIE